MEVLRLVLATVDAESSRLWCGGAWKGTKAAAEPPQPPPTPGLTWMELASQIQVPRSNIIIRELVKVRQAM